MIGSHLLRFQPLDADQFLKTKISGTMQPFQSFLDQDPVFPLEIHHVSHRSDRRKFQPFINLILRMSEPLQHRLHQLPCHSASAQSLERIGTIFLFGIYHRIRLRHPEYPRTIFQILIGNFMMIRNNHRHSQFFCQTDLIQR